MGVVYQATQLALDRTIALKVIAAGLLEDQAVRNRFVRESKVAASIDHPNVIPIYYAGEEHGIAYIAMRYVPGDDVRSLVRREGPLPPERAARIAAQIGSALDAAHSAGLVHRDIKPANVLLTAEDHVYLTDFGLTKHALSVAGHHEAGPLGRHARLRRARADPRRAHRRPRGRLRARLPAASTCSPARSRSSARATRRGSGRTSRSRRRSRPTSSTGFRARSTTSSRARSRRTRTSAIPQPAISAARHGRPPPGARPPNASGSWPRARPRRSSPRLSRPPSNRSRRSSLKINLRLRLMLQDRSRTAPRAACRRRSARRARRVRSRSASPRRSRSGSARTRTRPRRGPRRPPASRCRAWSRRDHDRPAAQRRPRLRRQRLRRLLPPGPDADRRRGVRRDPFLRAEDRARRLRGRDRFRLAVAHDRRREHARTTGRRARVARAASRSGCRIRRPRLPYPTTRSGWSTVPRAPSSTPWSRSTPRPARRSPGVSTRRGSWRSPAARLRCGSPTSPARACSAPTSRPGRWRTRSRVGRSRSEDLVYRDGALWAATPDDNMVYKIDDGDRRSHPGQRR